MVETSKQGLFVGLTTLDFIYLATRPPHANQKLVALDYAVAAGGPATNAAVTFNYLGDRARLLSAIGQHPITQLVRTDLEQRGIQLADLTPDRTDPVPTSSIIVTQATGDRAVISINAVRAQVSSDAVSQALGDRGIDTLTDINIILIDGHQMAVGQAIAQQATAHKIPVVIDGGSWKPGFESVLRLADYAICSANFHPPGCQTIGDVIGYLASLGIPNVAVTQGNNPIAYWSEEQLGQIAVPQIQAIDTLGAGDIFHGAFCHYILRTDFTEALSQSAAVTADACRFFGTRSWMEQR